MSSSESHDEAVELDDDSESTDRQPDEMDSPGSSASGAAAEEVQSDAPLGACALDYRDEEELSDSPASSSQSGGTHQMDLSSIFQILEDSAVGLLKDELKRSERYLSEDHPTASEPHAEDDKDSVLDDEEGVEDSAAAREGVRMITLNILRAMGQHDLADRLEKNELQMACQRIARCRLKKKFQSEFDGKSTKENVMPLSKIYTELHLSEDRPRGVSDDLGSWIDPSSLDPVTKGSALKCCDFFKSSPWKSGQIRTVMTKGVSGVGKTVTVQKFVLDWTERAENQDVHLIFDLPFRELNLLNDREWSLMELLQHFLPAIKMFESIDFSSYNILLIFDGLDECQLPLSFQSNENWSDAAKPTSLDVLLTNLIKGSLLPSAFVWITSRPTAAARVPLEHVDRMTEILGFDDQQKEEFFTKRFSDADMTKRVIRHVGSLRSLQIMCHVPFFCWISAAVFEKLPGEMEGEELPRTLTQMYTHFLIRHVFPGGADQKQSGLMELHKAVVLKVGRLAFQHLQRASVVFSEDDLIECGIDSRDSPLCYDVCRKIIQEEAGVGEEKLYSFLHPSIQEYLAALYVFLLDKERCVLTDVNSVDAKNTVCDLLKNAVDQAVRSERGHLDLYLRFLLGLFMDSGRTPFDGSQMQMESNESYIEQTVQCVKNKLKEKVSPERAISLFHCLAELGDSSLVEEVQLYLNSGDLSAGSLSPGQWSTLVVVLLISGTKLDVFDLKKFLRSEECLLRLLPVLRVSTTALLNGCELSEESCTALASAISCSDNCLRELDVTHNDLQDAGVKLLSAGLSNQHCKLNTLRLSGCRVTAGGCAALASALRSNPSHLRELHLSCNLLGDTGAVRLSDLLQDPRCMLEKLWLMSCGLTGEGFASLASALRSNPSHLKELRLSHNPLGLTGVSLLAGILENPACKLEKLELSLCGVTEEGCAALASALGSNPSYLRELDLSYNHLGDSGVKVLSALLQDPKFKLEKLRILPQLTNCATS
ncbi:NACHT, LRR and PYD domains-containing protein 12-like [Scleropages formosus]|nr:NACHT, LRR and PYD domains-containing protein 12-like [Scleropages formosus]